MRVRVPQHLAETFVGFINHIRRRPGDVFEIDDQPRRELFPGEKKLLASPDMLALYERIKDKDGKVPQLFSFRWMEPVDAGTPERITTAQKALDARSEVIRSEKAASRKEDVL